MISVILIKQYLYTDSNHKKRVASIRNKGIWPLYEAHCLHNEAICRHMRQIAITYHRGASVVRNLKFLTPFFVFSTTINIILSTNRSYVILPCVTNTY